MSDTLVIHPYDQTTNMLSLVYKDKGFDVVRDYNISKEELIKLISSHQRIIFLGHGTDKGLINPLFKNNPFSAANPYLIDDSFAPYLRDKTTISMWCFSDEFFARNNLKGFHTGMIISEVLEAVCMLGYSPLTEKQLYQNMVNLSIIFSCCINMEPEQQKEFILKYYVGDDEITKFNRNNIKVL